MAGAEWDEATDLWARYYDERHAAFPGLRFPRRPSTSDWFEAAWHEVALSLGRRGYPHERPFTPAFYLTVAQVLDDAGLAHDAIALLAGLDAVLPEHADDDQLRRTPPAAGTALHHPRDPARRDRPRARRGPRRAAGPDRRPRRPRPAAGAPGPRRVDRRDRAALDPLPQPEPAWTASSSALEAADGWPDAALGRDPLVDAAREWSDRYGERYAVEPHLPASTLSDAIFLSVYHEASQLAPDAAPGRRPRGGLDRDARDHRDPLDDGQLPRRPLGGGVQPLLPLLRADRAGGQRLPLLLRAGGHRGGSTDRRLPVALADGPEGHPPGAASGPPGRARRRGGAGAGRHPLVPAARRAAPRCDRLRVRVGRRRASPTTAATRVPRSSRRTPPCTPRPTSLPTFEFPLTRVAVLPGTDSLSTAAQPLDAVLEVSEPIGDRLGGLAAPRDVALPGAPGLDRPQGRRPARHPRGARGRLPAARGRDRRRRRTTRRRPGRPAPALQQPGAPPGPAGRDLRRGRGGHRDRRRDVARGLPRSRGPPRPGLGHHPRSGAALRPRRPAVGGDLRRHGHDGPHAVDRPRPARAEPTATCSPASRSLQHEQAIDVYFKPRGPAGDTEHWLFRTVGRTAHWQPVYIHGRRLDLPNQVFVSVSVGTTALLEGIAGGTPGFVVRDFPVRDYTTLDADAFPTLTVPGALDLLRGLATREGYDGLLQRERAWARTETRPGLSPGLGTWAGRRSERTLNAVSAPSQPRRPRWTA
ncbi:hypothetical protein G5V59_22790 [Nocardioides sp. W3-2-3]|uniref:hypothetical protein n=1 Tax=Nocardioides convexus TaxID=2712224 RepID=UPI002418A474|nr:hypothetical protein [Nocardioides convexus]NHA01630.1 hypothetical protein [Nocardioides convexus]